MPTHDLLTVDISTLTTPLPYRLSDAQGRCMQAGRLQGRATLSLGELPPGIYFLQVGDGRRNVFKVIKE